MCIKTLHENKVLFFFKLYKIIKLQVKSLTACCKICVSNLLITCMHTEEEQIGYLYGSLKYPHRVVQEILHFLLKRIQATSVRMLECREIIVQHSYIVYSSSLHT